MNRLEAIRAAQQVLPPGSDSIEITLEALRQLGIDLTARFDGEIIETYVREQAYQFRLWDKTGRAPMFFLRHHVILDERGGRRPRFHH